MRAVQDMLRDALGRDEVLRRARAQATLRRWSEVVGPVVSERSQPDRYLRGVVWVAVSGSAWAQELRMMKETILKRLGELSGEPELFQDVRFGVRPFSVPEPEMEEPAKQGLEDLSGLTIRQIAERRLAKWRNDRGVSS